MSRGLLPVAILAGGLATRLGPLAADRPKALIDVRGEPFIFHQLRLLAHEGVQRVVICTGHLGDQIAAAVNNGHSFGLEVCCSADGPRLRGTAGALKQALPLLGEAFFVLYGDSLLSCSFAAVQAAFEEHRTAGEPVAGLMTVFRNSNRWDASNVLFEAGRILRYDKVQRSPDMRHIDYGLGVLAAGAMDLVPGDQPCDLAVLYQRLLADGRLAGLEVRERFYEIGSPEGLAETRDYVAGLH